MILSRAPLSLPKETACDLHALGTPPAFVLSQDQTLRCVIFRSKSIGYTAQSSYCYGKVHSQGPGK